MLVKNNVYTNPSVIGVVGQDGILKSEPAVNSPERVRQLENLVYGQEVYSVIGFSEDAEKITALVETNEGKLFTFKIKLKSEIRDDVRFTLTNKELFDLSFFGNAIGMLGNRIKYQDRQNIRALLDKPRTDSEIVDDYLETLFLEASNYASKNGFPVPVKNIWKREYLAKHKESDILSAIQ